MYLCQGSLPLGNVTRREPVICLTKKKKLFHKSFVIFIKSIKYIFHFNNNIALISMSKRNIFSFYSMSKSIYCDYDMKSLFICLFTKYNAVFIMAVQHKERTTIRVIRYRPKYYTLFSLNHNITIITSLLTWWWLTCNIVIIKTYFQVIQIIINSYTSRKEHHTPCWIQ